MADRCQREAGEGAQICDYREHGSECEGTLDWDPGAADGSGDVREYACTPSMAWQCIARRNLAEKQRSQTALSASPVWHISFGRAAAKYSRTKPPDGAIVDGLVRKPKRTRLPH